MSFKSPQYQLSNLRPVLTLVAIAWLLGSLGLSWLVNSVLIIVGLLLVAPAIAFFGFQWWLSRSLVADKCPVCQFEFTGLKNTQLQCPNCGEGLSVDNKHFHRITPAGTIDVTAVEVPTKLLEE